MPPSFLISQGSLLSKLEISADISARLLAFINADIFTVRSRIAKSEYWKHYSEQLGAKISERSAEVTGGSGFYVPQRSSLMKRTAAKAMRAIKQPTKVASWIGRAIGSRFEVPRLMSCDKAFDAVMSSADVSVPINSAFNIDHRKLAQQSKAFSSAASVKRHYKNWSGYKASANIINHYYYLNILRAFVDKAEINTILEIGAGNGNFPSILYRDWAPVRLIMIDLPETLAVSIPFLSSMFPEAKIAMPNEIAVGGIPKEFDFAFLTVDQLEHIADDTIDLAINCHSFQEMTHEQIWTYFELVQRVCREAGFFFAANRTEKIPCGPDAFAVEQFDPPNRAAEFPWNPQNKVVVYEISKLSRLVQLDSVSIRLESIRKRSDSRA
jgi:putative sugar O-methyltransferase